MSPETQAKIRSLAARITADEPTRQELVDHLTDKLAAYLTGREKLSEADALILVERHFGDAKALRRELRGEPARPELLRRVGVMLLAICLGAIAEMAFFAWLLRIARPEWEPLVWLHYGIPVVRSLLYVTPLWLTGLWFRRHAARGSRPWIVRASPLVLVALIVGAIVFGTYEVPILNGPAEFVPGVVASAEAMRMFAPWFWSEVAQLVVIAWLGFRFCDASPRRWRPLLPMAAAWWVLAVCQALHFGNRQGMQVLWNPRLLVVMALYSAIFLAVGLLITTPPLLRRPATAA